MTVQIFTDGSNTVSDLVPRLRDALDALQGDSRRVQREVVRAIERERARALVQAVRDDCRATRARRLMRNVLELSADQTAYTRWVPLGAARYELIADAYALDAASEVRQP